jgi:ABC-type transporter MlaC component
MKTLRFTLAMVLMVSSVVFAHPSRAQKMQQQPSEARPQELETEQWQTKAEQKQIWRKMYRQDMKRLVKRLQALHPAGEKGGKPETRTGRNS